MAFLKGVDLSYCQKGFDYKAAKEKGVSFAIIRAGFSEVTDSRLEEHIEGCEKNGIDYGFYWYSYAMSVEEAKREAAACLRAIAGRRPSYPVFYDMEEGDQSGKLSRETVTDMALAFCKAVNDGGYPCGIYANPSWLQNVYDSSRIVGKYDIWLAHWTNSPNSPSKYDYGQTVWQWGIDCINGMDVDGNICFTDYPAAVSMWYEEHGVQQESKADEPVPAYKRGDNVMLAKGAKFVGGVTPYSWVYDTVFTVYATAAQGSELMIGLGGEVTGWIYSADAVSPPCRTAEKKKFSTGDRVTVKRGALTCKGEKLASFVYDNVYTVLQAGTNKDPDYTVIGVDGKVTAAVSASDLEPA